MLGKVARNWDPILLRARGGFGGLPPLSPPPCRSIPALRISPARVAIESNAPETPFTRAACGLRAGKRRKKRKWKRKRKWGYSVCTSESTHERQQHSQTGAHEHMLFIGVTKSSAPPFPYPPRFSSPPLTTIFLCNSSTTVFTSSAMRATIPDGVQGAVHLFNIYAPVINATTRAAFWFKLPLLFFERELRHEVQAATYCCTHIFAA